MGLDTTHDCWHGAYSSFHRWRSYIARLAFDIDLRTMEGFCEVGRDWSTVPDSPIKALLMHSDCGGSISVAECGPLADALQALLVGMPEGDEDSGFRDMRADTEQFITGLREAVSLGEDVEFH